MKPTRIPFLLCLLLCSCGGDTGSGAPTPAPSASASNARTSAQAIRLNGTGTSGTTSGSGRNAPGSAVTPPFDLEKSLEAAFRKCEIDYVHELANRRVPSPVVTRVLPYEIREDREARQIEYRLTMRSSFVYFDNNSSTELEGSLVREILQCTPYYDEASQLLILRSTIRLEAASKAREEAEKAKQAEEAKQAQEAEASPSPASSDS